RGVRPVQAEGGREPHVDDIERADAGHHSPCSAFGGQQEAVRRGTAENGRGERGGARGARGGGPGGAGPPPEAGWAQPPKSAALSAVTISVPVSMFGST